MVMIVMTIPTPPAPVTDFIGIAILNRISQIVTDTFPYLVTDDFIIVTV